MQMNALATAMNKNNWMYILENEDYLFLQHSLGPVTFDSQHGFRHMNFFYLITFVIPQSDRPGVAADPEHPDPEVVHNLSLPTNHLLRQNILLFGPQRYEHLAASGNFNS